MELTVAVVISIVSVVITVINFALSRKDKAVKDTKEINMELAQKETNMELVQYQLTELKEDYKSIASDIKEIKKMLDTYRDTFKSMIKEQLEEHVKIYHNGGNK